MYFKIFLLTFIVESSSFNLLNVCQSGIRDDGTNYVHCAKKSLKDIPRFTSNRLFNLAFDELILSDNLITQIHENSFKGLRIKRLIMSGNNLISIDKNSFRELENYLEDIILEFDTNVVNQIPEAVQNNLINIKSLTLIGLNLRVLPSNIFQNMKKLESLTLKSCNIQFIELNSFKSIENQLRYLNLDYNKLNKKVFQEINRLNLLERLSLSNNYIREFNIKLSNKKLKYLDLSYNYLKKLNIINLDNLQIFNLQNNLLKSECINGSIPDKLKELILDFNSIHHFNKNFIGKQNSLEILSIQSNDFLLDQIDTFQYLNKLKKLNLARNSIRMIPRGLFNFTPSLEYLNMDRNPLDILSIDTFSGLENSLKNLSLQSCSLTSQSLIAFSNLRNLERLKLQSNLIKIIYPENLFSSLSKLVLIDLQRNQLTHISSQFPSSLRELELGHNLLQTLPFNNQTFHNLSQLITLDLSLNPLHCDCNIKPLYYWLLANFQSELVPYVQWICSTPKYLEGKQLGSLNEYDFICEEKRISLFNVWLKDPETAVVEWPFETTPSKLVITENDTLSSIIDLNNTENFVLLEKLKLSTDYSLCLQSNEQYSCRNLTTIKRSIVPLYSSLSPSKTVIISIEYLIVGISLGIVFILIIIFLLVLLWIKCHEKYSHSSKTTITNESYYQTNGSDTTQTASCNNSLIERSMNSLNHQHHHPTMMLCYCQIPSMYNREQQSYHFYHEIPTYKSPVVI